MKTKTSQYIPLSKIIPDENQPRKYFAAEKIATLKESIKKFGIMTPLVVEQVGQNYLLVDGERRYRASKELKLTEVPVIVTESKNETDRLIEQFHIQEQHEGWSPAEKAMTLHKLAKELGVGMTEAYKLLGIQSRTASTYMAFASIIDKEAYVRSEIGLTFATSFNSIKRIAKNLSTEKLGKSFTKTDERTLERALIKKIKDGEISRPTDISKIKDIFVKDPKSISEFIKGEITTDELYIKTKARGSTNLRRLKLAAAYFGSYVNKFLEHADVEVTHEVMIDVKYAKKAAETFLSRFDK